LKYSIFESGELDRRTRELIAIASSVLMRCQFCVDIHSQRAFAQGASKREIAEAIAVGVIVAGGSQLHWTSINGEKIFGKKKPEEPENEKGCCCGN
jgi:AhpD family alkylhydroperoxidase